MKQTFDKIIGVTLRNQAGRMDSWKANALVRVLIADVRRREKERWNALPSWRKVWLRITGRGFL